MIYRFCAVCDVAEAIAAETDYSHARASDRLPSNLLRRERAVFVHFDNEITAVFEVAFTDLWMSRGDAFPWLNSQTNEAQI